MNKGNKGWFIGLCILFFLSGMFFSSEFGFLSLRFILSLGIMMLTYILTIKIFVKQNQGVKK